jgi:Ca2+-binding RTX toxin-like protein
MDVIDESRSGIDLKLLTSMASNNELYYNDTISIINSLSSLVIGGAGNDKIQAMASLAIIIGDEAATTFAIDMDGKHAMVDLFSHPALTMATGNDIIDAIVSQYGLIIGNDGSDDIVINLHAKHHQATILVCGDSCSISYNVTNQPYSSNISALLEAESSMSHDDNIIINGASHAIVSGGHGHDFIQSSAVHDYLCGDFCDIVMVNTSCHVDAYNLAVMGVPLYMTTLSTALDGNDIIEAGNGASIVFGGGGSDIVHGHGGSDIIVGDWYLFPS